MKVTFLGTGTSMGVPVAGGYTYRKERSSDPRDFRYRTSVWIQTEQASIVIDTGPEFRLQTLRSGLTDLDLLLLTHEHTDHIAGIDDLRPFCYKNRSAIRTYTSQNCIEALKYRFHYMFEPNKTPGSVSFDFHVLQEEKSFRDCRITPLPVKHGKMDVLGFRINDFAYVTDTNFIPDDTREKINGSKVMVISGLRWEPDHPTHYTIPQAIEVAKELNIPQTYLIHMSEAVTHSETEALLPDGIHLAYDQLQITI